MAEYIEREAAFDAITDIAGKTSTRSAYEAVWKSARTLKKIPTADVAPVVHGKWIESANFDAGFWVCSKCRFVSKAIAAHKLYGYCPNCGAKMDGVADG